MKSITVSEVEYIAYSLARQLMDYDEPLPPFETRYPGTLESCINQPFQTFNGKYLYYFTYQKAALLFYLIIKNHPFKNGNKRMAVTITFYLLYKNKRWLNISPTQLYKIACHVAESDSKNKDVVLKVLNDTFKNYIVKNI